jgi:hypothetical protein
VICVDLLRLEIPFNQMLIIPAQIIPAQIIPAQIIPAQIIPAQIDLVKKLT